VSDRRVIPVIDLFAGPGGLGEGFSASLSPSGFRPFRIALSIEMEKWAHQTLELRSFFRKFAGGNATDAYYDHLRGQLNRSELFAAFPDEAHAAGCEAWSAELGVVQPSEVDRRIKDALGGAAGGLWILCGGPPCQAFSVVGRSRNGGIAEGDHRVYLYKQYLRILSVHEPPVFIMENVKGLLSSAVNGSDIFDQMLDDLSHPAKVIRGARRAGAKYALHSISPESTPYYLDGRRCCRPDDFVVRCENYGIPQTRHRVIILGVREDLARTEIPVLRTWDRRIPAGRVLRGLPRLRSGLTRTEDGKAEWRLAVASILDSDFMHSRRNGLEGCLREYIAETVYNLRDMQADRGGEFVSYNASSDFDPEWFLDPLIGGICNASTRPHMETDLHRYLFAACYARIYGRSPELNDFPAQLHPDHKNLKAALSKGYFDDRFRVQMANRPATTITSHIAKDGHFFIHYDETQCRSLTVREAARLQTFPDNYYFCGPRTHQYRQVGNAVPPLLARQIADIALQVLKGGKSREHADRPQEAAI
jgi:DNA (cytosine-5)-methyltransferase 1